MFSSVPARLAERELDIAADTTVHYIVSPARGVTGVDEPSQFVSAAEELTALAGLIGSPLYGELHVLGDELE